MKDYTNKSPNFASTIQIPETTDPAHADNLNVPTKQLLQNTLVNHSLIVYNADAENKIYKGRNLATVFAEEIKNYDDEWAWIRARIKAGNYTGIYIGDYIPVTMNNETVNMQVAGIDCYYKTTDQQLGHHIDFISKDCFSETVKWHLENKNNGNAESPYPYMASNLYKYLTETLYGYLPDKVKKQIAHKRMILEQRYSASGVLTDSTTWGWQDMGPLWVPTEYEVFGSVVWGTPGWSAGQAMQYPIFANSYVNRIKGAGPGGGRTGWWLASAGGGSSIYVVYVGNSGNSYSNNANNSFYVPVCFRITA